jgi:hypothetical protein
LIDGTFISGTGAFYMDVQQVFEAAKQNAPSIIFIDDSDAIVESGEELGLYRYLLTMLDGLESESAGRVCVMMTAMDIGNRLMFRTSGGRAGYDLTILDMSLSLIIKHEIMAKREFMRVGGGLCPYRKRSIYGK